MRPRYLICDELSSMLDVSTQAALLETIAPAVERGLGVLLITHDRVLADTGATRSSRCSRTRVGHARR